MHLKIARRLAKTYLSKLDSDGPEAAEAWANRTISGTGDTEQVVAQIKLVRAGLPPEHTA